MPFKLAKDALAFPTTPYADGLIYSLELGLGGVLVHVFFSFVSTAPISLLGPLLGLGATAHLLGGPKKCMKSGTTEVIQ